MAAVVQDRESEFVSALDASLEGFVHRTLKEQQRECIRRIVCEKKDVFAVLPTGFGKSAIYQLIPKVLSHMGRTADDIQTTVAVVSPLDYIRKQQVAAIEKLNFGISAAAIGESNLNDKEIEEGRFEIVYGSAEQWLSDRWRKALQFGALHQTKVLVVDEVHTVATWGLGKKGKAAFWEAFGRVAELRSCLESGTPLLALTATANKEMRNRLIKCLGMKSGDLIIVSPNKDNIRFTVLQADKQFLCFNWLLSFLREEKQNTPFSIIFCKTVNDIVSLLTYFLMKLGNSGLYVDGESPIHERCLLDVYYSQTPKRHKDCVTSSFEGVSGNVRVVFATTSLSMGIDFPHVKYVIHYGPSNNLTSHLQEAGRGGRDGNQAFHITLYHGRHLITCEGDIKTAVKHSLKSCCRVEFLRSFDETVSPLEPLHDCCSVCHQRCNCLGDGCGKVVPEFDFVPESVEDVKKSRNVSENDKECVKEALKEVQRSVSCQTQVRMFDDSGIISHGFSDKLIDKIVSNVNFIYNVHDVIEHCNPRTLKVAVIILEIVKETFEDVEITDELYSLVYAKEQTHLLDKLNASLGSTIDLEMFDDLLDLEEDLLP